MSLTRLGSSGLSLKQPIGVGTMLWGDSWVDSKFTVGSIIPSETLQEISEIFLSAGVTFFDSAEGYGGGASERRLAESVDSLPGEDAVLATKFIPTIWRWTKASFMRSLRGSLARMKRSHIELYFIHTPLHPLPIEHWCHAVADAVDAGLIKAIGLSNFNAHQITRAHKVFSARGMTIAANQMLLNLLDYNCPHVQHTLKVCREYNIRVIGYSPVGQGLLVDGLTPEKMKSIRVAKITGITWAQLEGLRAVISEIAKSHGKTMAQVCLNWAVAHEYVPLVGIRTVKQAKDAVGALEWRLTPQEVERLDQAALSLSTLKKPRWRRAIFIVMISMLVMSYYIFSFFERFIGFHRQPPPQDKKAKKLL